MFINIVIQTKKGKHCKIHSNKNKHENNQEKQELK